MSEIVKYATDSGTEIQLTADIIRRNIAKNEQVTDTEIFDFMMLCKAQRLNPFIKEAYLVKYGTFAASIVVGKDVFTKRAQHNEDFDGYEAGITVVDKNGELAQRPGSLIAPGDTLVGGWARVFKKSQSIPMFDEVALDEYMGKKKDGTPNGQWVKMPATMIRKVALVHALREAFPDDLQGLYDASEMNIELSEVSQESSPLASLQEAEAPQDWHDEVIPQIITLIQSSKLNDDKKAQSIAALQDISEDDARKLLFKYQKAAAKAEAAKQ